MEAIAALQDAYADSSDDQNSGSDNDESKINKDDLLHLKPLGPKSETSLALSTINSNPEVITKVKVFINVE